MVKKSATTLGVSGAGVLECHNDTEHAAVYVSSLCVGVRIMSGQVSGQENTNHR